MFQVLTVNCLSKGHIRLVAAAGLSRNTVSSLCFALSGTRAFSGGFNGCKFEFNRRTLAGPQKIITRNNSNLPRKQDSSNPNDAKQRPEDKKAGNSQELSEKKPMDPNDWKLIRSFIPGETPLKDKLQDRVPKFPLGKENVPTLLPRPGVPQVGKNLSFRQVINILKNKTNPELIYESEPHRLYFLMSFCFGATLFIYSAVLLEWAVFESNREYHENKEEQNEVIRKREWVLNVAKKSIFGLIALTSAIFVIKFPTRLVRRMYYLPGPIEHIKFTTYPLLPGQSTPVITIPLKNVERKHKARIWTGKGFYGTSDNSFFFFVLRELDDKGKTVKNWVIDRKGFFWSDGRIFDYLFGKETIAEAEAGIPYDEQIGIINKQVNEKKKQLRQQHGIFYKWKYQKQEMKKDVKKVFGKEKKKLGGK